MDYDGYFFLLMVNGTYAMIIKQRIIETLFIANVFIINVNFEDVSVFVIRSRLVNGNLYTIVMFTMHSYNLLLCSLNVWSFWKCICVRVGYIYTRTQTHIISKCHMYYLSNFSFHRIWNNWWKFMVVHTIVFITLQCNRLYEYEKNAVLFHLGLFYIQNIPSSMKPNWPTVTFWLPNKQHNKYRLIRMFVQRHGTNNTFWIEHSSKWNLKYLVSGEKRRKFVESWALESDIQWASGQNKIQFLIWGSES